ncbi:hypothetical protein NPIL_455851, partial [Nephila pilipes]
LGSGGGATPWDTASKEHAAFLMRAAPDIKGCRGSHHGGKRFGQVSSDAKGRAITFKSFPH